MLVFSVIFSAILLGEVIWAACISHRTLSRDTMILVPVGMGFFCIFPVVGWHALGLIVAALPGVFLDRRSLSIGLALLATVVVWGFALHAAAEHERALKAQYPLESMAARLPHSPWPVASLPPDIERRLIVMEKEAAESQARDMIFRVDSYRRALEAIHGESRMAFVNSPGFGISRMRPYSALDRPHGLDEDMDPVPQPSQGDLPLAWSTGNLPGASPGWFQRDQAEWTTGRHLSMVSDFAQLRTPTVIKNRGTFGFRPHELRQTAPLTQSPPLDLQRVELVGLLLKEQPRVYLSDELPRMEDIRNVGTRELDGFEQTGLKALAEGELLFVREQADHVRMLGAIRSTSQCVACHGGSRGDLLGAFSYWLQRKK